MLTKLQAKVFFLGGTAVFFGIFLVLSIDTHLKVPDQTNAKNLTPAVIAGKHIWEQNNCMGCHTLFGEGAYYAPELTKVVERRGADWLRVFLKDPQAMFPGQRKMVQYHFKPDQIEDAIAFLDWCGKVDLNGFPAKPPLAQRLEATTPTAPAVLLPKPVPAIFTTAACIGCHSISGEGGAAGADRRRDRDRVERGDGGHAATSVSGSGAGAGGGGQTGDSPARAGVRRAGDCADEQCASA